MTPPRIALGEALAAMGRAEMLLRQLGVTHVADELVGLADLVAIRHSQAVLEWEMEQRDKVGDG